MAGNTHWGFEVSLNVDTVDLELRSAYGTSHSLTTSRTNARVSVSISIRHLAETDPDEAMVYSGIAEIGMPPKKRFVYEAELSDLSSKLLSLAINLFCINCV